MNLFLALLASSLVLLAGCDSSRTDPARSQTDGDLQLELGETASSDGLTITFEAITTDSRCPENVDCIWAGEAIVQLGIDGVPEVLLVSDPELAPEAVVRRGNVLLRAVELTPYPGSRAHDRGDTPVVSLTAEVVSE